ncbi:hypothetical protein QZH41_003761 [Actinostola sp. cb2023]|nr:hypothetical protein QZH41_003761 [Actinostola sp. cb2023]
MASIYLPPIARKKKVDGWPRQDTSRVFSDFQVNLKQETKSSYGSHFVRHNVPPTLQRAASPTRKNKPQPTTVTFLRQNPRFVCEPICHVDTLESQEEIFHTWWPNETLQRPVTKPQYSLNSTSRADYKNFSLCSPRSASFSRQEVSSTSKPQGAVGILPGYAPSQVAPHISEKISYEHQFNSRLDPSHPIRGKRHGCFVWKVSTPVQKTEHGRHLKKTALRERKGVFYELKNTDTIDDAKTIVSTIGEKPKSAELSVPDKNNTPDTLEPKIKTDAWSSPEIINNDQQCMVAKQPQQTMHNGDLLDLTEREMEDVIKPSRPRRHSPPPHSA